MSSSVIAYLLQAFVILACVTAPQKPSSDYIPLPLRDEMVAMQILKHSLLAPAHNEGP